MYKFFVDEENIQEEYINITGDDVNHIKNVLRLQVGEKISVSNKNETEYICTIDQVLNDLIRARIVDYNRDFGELSTKITLYQGFPKSDKFELIIQKVVELGACTIVPVITQRTIVKLDEKKEAKKIERYNAIAEAAAKQSKRGIIPTVTNVISFKEAIKQCKELSMNIIPYEEAIGIENTKEIVKNIKGKESLGIFIGPEGGFSKEEITLAMDSGVIPITLGHRILRTETAPITAMSIIMFELEED